MHASIRLFSARVHQPLIQFMGKRGKPFKLDVPHAHPAAPPELKKTFSDFVKKVEASSSSTAPVKDHGNPIFPEFWEAPDRFWKPKVREVEDIEIDAILSGGASLR